MKFNEVLDSIKKGNFQEAIKILKHPQNLNNNNFQIFYLLAVAYNGIKDIDQSIENLYKCINLKPDFIQGLEFLAELNLLKGNLKDAEKIFSKILEIDKNHLSTLYKLLNINDKEVSESVQENIKKLINNKKISDENKALGFFILADSEKKNKNYKLEMNYLNKSHEYYFNYKLKSNKQSLFYYSKIISRFYNAILYSGDKKKVLDEINPIFIIGLPRSGSTLIESILQSSKQKIPSIGESSVINFSVVNQIRDLIFEKNFQIEEFKLNLNLNSITKNIFSKLNEIKILNNNKKTYFIDKSLENFFYIEIILKIFPNAKIINMNRDPRHSVIAIYQKLLPLISWSNSINDILNYIDNYLKIIKFYKKKYPKKIYDLSLEDLSREPEIITKKVFKFCEIEWTSACLKYYENKDLISRTSSNVQIRKKIFRYDNKKFKNYDFLLRNFVKKYPWLNN
ncbi:MAG: tetratricopeptide repeat-containing sulfotransferase family protein [Candidatus Pelagibacter sp.]